MVPIIHSFELYKIPINKPNSKFLFLSVCHAVEMVDEASTIDFFKIQMSSLMNVQCTYISGITFHSFYVYLYLPSSQHPYDIESSKN